MPVKMTTNPEIRQIGAGSLSETFSIYTYIEPV
jgi:hypothetical protein